MPQRKHLIRWFDGLLRLPSGLADGFSDEGAILLRVRESNHFSYELVLGPDVTRKCYSSTRRSYEVSRKRTQTLITSAIVKSSHLACRRERRRIPKAPVASSFNGGSLCIFISVEVVISLPPKRVRKSSLNLDQVRPPRTGICVSQCAAVPSRALLIVVNNSLSCTGLPCRSRLTFAHHTTGSTPAISGLKRDNSLGSTFDFFHILSAELTRARWSWAVALLPPALIPFLISGLHYD